MTMREVAQVLRMSYGAFARGRQQMEAAGMPGPIAGLPVLRWRRAELEAWLRGGGSPAAVAPARPARRRASLPDETFAWGRALAEG